MLTSLKSHVDLFTGTAILVCDNSLKFGTVRDGDIQLSAEVLIIRFVKHARSQIWGKFSLLLK